MSESFAYFPYELREGQREFIRFVQEKTARGRSVCLSASTGFGKTPAILAALLPQLNGGCVIWSVRTGNETDRPIEELKAINVGCGADFFGFSYRGKRDMCLLARDMGIEAGYLDVGYLCKTKVGKGECVYHDNFYPGVLEPEEPMLYSEIIEVCTKKMVCPYLAQRSLLPYADVIGLNYNYIINEGMGWSIRRQIPFDESFLVVDEAHNLQRACANLNSDEITLGTLTYALGEIGRFDTPHAKEVENNLRVLREEIEVMHRSMGKEAAFDVWKFLGDFTEKACFGPSDLNGFFESVRAYGSKIRAKQLGEGKRPHSSLYHLGNFWLAAMGNAGVEGIAFIATREGKNLRLEMWDMRAAAVLRDRWPEFRACVFCSGTLAPIDAFAETIGLHSYEGMSFRSHYDPRRTRTLITMGLSTKGDKLTRAMAARYVEAIDMFISSLDANLAVFSSSYRIQNGLMKAGLRDVIESNKRRFFYERRGMRGDDAREMLEGFKRCAWGQKQRGVLCATTTGRFAEGADFPGRELEGIFLVGIPFERASVRTELYIKYYEGLYGKRKGNYYAYIVPALRRASQALGRSLRSKEDRTVLICGDERYSDKRFFHLLPDYVREGARVVEAQSIPSEVEGWRREVESMQSTGPLLESLADAVEQRKAIWIKYLSREGLTERHVEPQGIREGKYLIGHCHHRGKTRTFRIDKIIELRVE